MYAILAVFIAGLMVGRTPEYLGKKIESFEVKMASIALLISPANILISPRSPSVGTLGHGFDPQSRSPWTDRDPLRLYVSERQQWLGLCRPDH